MAETNCMVGNKKASKALENSINLVGCPAFVKSAQSGRGDAWRSRTRASTRVVYGFGGLITFIKGLLVLGDNPT